MRNLFLMTLMLSCFIVPAFGSERVNGTIVFTVQLKDELLCLKYLGRTNIEKIKKFFSDNTIRDNETFFAVTVNKSNIQQAECRAHEGCVLDKDKIIQIYNNLQNNLQYLPLKYFVAEKKENAFKSYGDELCSYTRTDSLLEQYVNISIPHTYNVGINLVSKIADYSNPADLLASFRNSPAWNLDDEEELIKSKILAKEKNGEISHGINSLLGQEIKAKEQALFYSRLKKVFIGGFALILMYVLYKKIYTTS